MIRFLRLFGILIISAVILVPTYRYIQHFNHLDFVHHLFKNDAIDDTTKKYTEDERVHQRTSFKKNILTRKKVTKKQLALLVPALENYHADALYIISNVSTDKTNTQKKLKEWILIHNNECNKYTKRFPFFGRSDSNSPYTQYKKIIDDDIRYLQKAIFYTCKKQDCSAWKERAEDLIEQLDALIKEIIITDEYHNETILKSVGTKSSVITSLATHGIIFAAKKILFGGFF